MNEYDIWFSRVQMSNGVKYKLLEYADSKRIWDMSSKDLKEFGLNDIQIDNILDNYLRYSMQKYLEYMERYDIKFMSYKNSDYPTILKDISNFPVFLYYRGNVQNLYEDNVAIVGSRKASVYGKKVALELAEYLCDKNVNVVSGLAIRYR